MFVPIYVYLDVGVFRTRLYLCKEREGERRGKRISVFAVVHGVYLQLSDIRGEGTNIVLRPLRSTRILELLWSAVFFSLHFFLSFLLNRRRSSYTQSAQRKEDEEAEEKLEESVRYMSVDVYG